MFAELAAPIVSLLNQLMGPLLLIVGALGSLYCVVLGVKYAKAEEPQEREKAKGALKGAVVGFLLIFVFPLEYVWCFGFPIALVNAFLQLLPVFIQRYNRPKLLKLYEYNKKIAERKNKSA